MSSTRDGFDPIGIIVDWLDACREGRLAALVDLYDDKAIVDCCQGGTFRGRLGVEKYWRSKLTHPANRAFEVDALFPEADGVCLDYRAYDGICAHAIHIHQGGKNLSHCLLPDKTGRLSGPRRSSTGVAPHRADTKSRIAR
jgi:SnoaL-like domain